MRSALALVGPRTELGVIIRIWPGTEKVFECYGLDPFRKGGLRQSR